MKPATAAIPTQLGALEACGHYYNVVPGDSVCCPVASFARSVSLLTCVSGKVQLHCGEDASCFSCTSA
jgi:hypothetical protein